MLTAVTILGILTISVVIHELAHFFAAKSVGVPVRAFSVGMGPVLLRHTWRGTEWRVSLLPLGGYVDLPGLAAEVGDDGELREATEGLARKNIWQKLWVLSAGVIANYLLAVLLFATVTTADSSYRAVFAGTKIQGATQIVEALEGSEAERLGIEAGDIILRINEVELPTPEALAAEVGQDGSLEIVIERGEEILTLNTIWAPDPNPDGSRPLFGVSSAFVLTETPPPVSFPRAVWEASGTLVRVVPEAVAGFVRGVGSTFTGTQTEDLVGPVGMVNLAGQAARAGLLQVLLFAGIINFSLAVFNLLPIPALDGGRMLLASIIAIRGKPFRPGQEEFIHFVGFVALMAFFVLITLNELGDLFRRG